MSDAEGYVRVSVILLGRNEVLCSRFSLHFSYTFVYFVLIEMMCLPQPVLVKWMLTQLFRKFWRLPWFTMAWPVACTKLLRLWIGRSLHLLLLLSRKVLLLCSIIAIALIYSLSRAMIAMSSNWGLLSSLWQSRWSVVSPKFWDHVHIVGTLLQLSFMIKI